MNGDILQHLGPLSALAGVWEGDKGDDVAPSGDRGTKQTVFRERLIFEPFGPVKNHEQELYGLRCARMVWRLGEDAPFHEDTGYWLWDAAAKQVLRCLAVPRGVAVLAGGTVEPDAKAFEISAEAGSDTYGICSNKFLDREFKTVRYELRITVHGQNSFTYREDTQLKIKGQKEIFHHTDANQVTRVG